MSRETTTTTGPGAGIIRPLRRGTTRAEKIPMTREPGERQPPAAEWWESLLTCGFLFHDFECRTDTTAGIRSFRCKKCGFVSTYREVRSADGAPVWKMTTAVDPAGPAENCPGSARNSGDR